MKRRKETSAVIDYPHGTVNCDHRTAREMIDEARRFLIQNAGKAVEDPGYF